MTLPPQNVVQVNGITQASDAYLNTLVQWVPNVAALRSFTGIGGMSVQCLGFTAANDGGQGLFYWNSANTAADDGGLTTVVPGGSTSGGWNRLQGVTVGFSSYLVPVSGFSYIIPNYTNLIILNPVGTLASGSVTMPASLYDGQTVSITTSQTITSFTINANAGQTVVGAPSTITSTTPVKFVYKLSLKTFFRGL